MAAFNRIRETWVRRFKAEKESMERPDLPVIVNSLGTLRSTNPDALNQTMASLEDSPITSLKQLYAVVFNSLLSFWFFADGAPLATRGIARSLQIEQVNTLVKVIDKSSGGFRHAHQLQKTVEHQPRASRMSEVIKQRHEPRSRLPSPAIQDAQQKLRRDLRLAALSDIERAACDIKIQQAALQALHDEFPAEEDAFEIDEAGRSLIEDAVAKLAQAKDTYKKLRLKDRTPRKTTVNPENIMTINDTSNKGLNTGNPASKKDRGTIVHIDNHTPDPSNPCDYWFRNGCVIGYPTNIVDEIISFQDTDWEGDPTVDDPTFAVGGGDVSPPAHVTTVQELKKQDVGSTTAGASSQHATPSGKNDREEAEPLLDLAAMSEAEQQAYDNNKRRKEARIARAERARKIRRYDPGQVTRETGNDTNFTARLLKESKFDGIALTPNKSHELLDRRGKKKVTEKDNFVGLNANDEHLRLNVEQTTELMDNYAYQPRDYRKALIYARIASRQNPVIPGQNPIGNKNLWWQTTGAVELCERRDRNVQKRLKQLINLRKKGAQHAEQRSYKEVMTGAVLADKVGIGKTDTCAAFRLIRTNGRKADLQNMYNSGNTEGLVGYTAPRPALAVTQPHLTMQIAKSFAQYSQLFHVYIYSGTSTDLPPGVTKITENLTRDYPLFNTNNEHNSQVIVVTSYATLSA
ncbi:hypothetical protein B5807_04039 [Epicoccum nigrum]|uniref:Uncharacterized protein n=1 Tax=Epicoccum nigrum TaxID=105696 RepID=A0A1Y2M7A8_EPING|nr:hypothetical protein B5807_04039 [Epicoccum nigrum]